jgi:hypothetical protein
MVPTGGKVAVQSAARLKLALCLRLCLIGHSIQGHYVQPTEGCWICCGWRRRLRPTSRVRAATRPSLRRALSGSRGRNDIPDSILHILAGTLLAQVRHAKAMQRNAVLRPATNRCTSSTMHTCNATVCGNLGVACVLRAGERCFQGSTVAPADMPPAEPLCVCNPSDKLVLEPRSNLFQ